MPAIAAKLVIAAVESRFKGEMRKAMDRIEKGVKVKPGHTFKVAGTTKFRNGEMAIIIRFYNRKPDTVSNSIMENSPISSVIMIDAFDKEGNYLSHRGGINSPGNRGHKTIRARKANPKKPHKLDGLLKYVIKKLNELAKASDELDPNNPHSAVNGVRHHIGSYANSESGRPAAVDTDGMTWTWSNEKPAYWQGNKFGRVGVDIKATDKVIEVKTWHKNKGKTAKGKFSETVMSSRKISDLAHEVKTWIEKSVRDTYDKDPQYRHYVVSRTGETEYTITSYDSSYSSAPGLRRGGKVETKFTAPKDAGIFSLSKLAKEELGNDSLTVAVDDVSTVTSANADVFRTAAGVTTAVTPGSDADWQSTHLILETKNNRNHVRGRDAVRKNLVRLIASGKYVKGGAIKAFTNFLKVVAKELNAARVAADDAPVKFGNEAYAVASEYLMSEFLSEYEFGELDRFIPKKFRVDGGRPALPSHADAVRATLPKLLNRIKDDTGQKMVAALIESVLKGTLSYDGAVKGVNDGLMGSAKKQALNVLKIVKP